MKDYLLKTLLNLKGEKLIRHALTGLIGFAAAHGVVLDIDNTASFASGLVLLLLVIAWSAWRKVKPDAEVMDLLKTVATSAGTQLAALSAGYLTAKGIASPDQAQTPAAALLALVVYGLSKKAAPDVKKIVPLLLLCCMCASLTACDSVTVVKQPNGGYAINTGTLGSDSTYREVVITQPDGLRIEHKVWDQKQSKSLRGAVMASAMPEMISAGASGAAKLTDAVSKAVK
jgi:hypothetical protein